MTHQRHRYKGAVGSYLNYSRTEMVLLQALVRATGQLQKQTSRAVATLIANHSSES